MKELLNVWFKLYFLLLFTYLRLLEEKFLMEVSDNQYFCFKADMHERIFI
jgi:hypothetical protein